MDINNSKNLKTTSGNNNNINKKTNDNKCENKIKNIKNKEENVKKNETTKSKKRLSDINLNTKNNKKKKVLIDENYNDEFIINYENNNENKNFYKNSYAEKLDEIIKKYGENSNLNKNMDNDKESKSTKKLNNKNLENISDNLSSDEEYIPNSEEESEYITEEYYSDSDTNNTKSFNTSKQKSNNLKKNNKSKKKKNYNKDKIVNKKNINELDKINESKKINKLENINKEIKEIDKDKDAMDLLTKLIIEKNINNLFKNISYEEEFEDEYDSNDEEVKYQKYLDKLSKKERNKILKIEKKIKKYNTSKIPLKAKIINLPVDIGIKSNLLEKYEQFIEMEPSDSEYFKLNKYIKGIFKIPFNKYIEIPITLSNTSEEIMKYFNNIKSTLDKSIYGQTKTKNILLESIAKWITNPKSCGNVIGLCGPPGIGKTTIIKHGLAQALNVPFSFIPLGGTTSSSFLIGHDYTYEGSTWGKIVSTIIEKKCMNPIIFFDELDKVSNTKEGDEIIGTLTHLTDTTQNSTFYDRYYNDVPLDLSKAIFIFSFNHEEKINPILKDRINIIHLDGFNSKEKIEIVKNYSIKSICNNIGISSNNYKFDDYTIQYIINNFTDEKGVRSLNRCVETILMKLNFLRLNGNMIDNKKIEYPLIINVDIINKFLKDINKPNEFLAKNMYI